MDIITNGYRITGSHDPKGREYHVSDSNGIVFKTTGKAAANEYASGLPPGDVKAVPEIVQKPTKRKPPIKSRKTLIKGTKK